MAIYTEAQARKKRSFEDCGDAAPPFRTCVASDCIAWVWDDAEAERYSRAFGSYSAEWKAFSPGSAYTQDEVPKPEGENIGWMKYAPYMKEDPKGWWTRPRQDRQGHCGRVLLTAVLEAP